MIVVRWRKKLIINLLLIAGILVIFIKLYYSRYRHNHAREGGLEGQEVTTEKGQEVTTEKLVLVNIPKEYGKACPSLSPWYFTHDVRLNAVPISSNNFPKLWPEENPKSDRILEQLMSTLPTLPTKTKLIFFNISEWEFIEEGQNVFIRTNCPIKSCKIVTDSRKINEVDLIVNPILDLDRNNTTPTPALQLSMMATLESPFHTNFSNNYNLTATYRPDSDITAPYGKWVYYLPGVHSIPTNTNYAEGKTRKVAWFVSNCKAMNNRATYAKQLQQYISVDIYGQCGNLSCPKGPTCYKYLSAEYKFYLAFENSNCRYYITEKLFLNGFENNILPIVMGAHPDDYKAVAPYHSYIHIEDYPTPKDLANYLHYLDKNDTAYNEYFQWKGTGEFINTRFYCRVCLMLHHFHLYKSKEGERSIKNLEKWWDGPGICLHGHPFRWINKTNSYTKLYRNSLN